MTLNDLWDELSNSEGFLIFIMFGVLLFMIPLMLSMFAKNLTSKDVLNIYGDNESGPIRQEVNVKIVSKRTVTYPTDQTIIINKVVFEFTNQSRLELAIKDGNAYGTMVEGDIGQLTYQGKKFISFRRENKNEKT